MKILLFVLGFTFSTMGSEIVLGDEAPRDLRSEIETSLNEEANLAAELVQSLNLNKEDHESFDAIEGLNKGSNEEKGQKDDVDQKRKALDELREPANTNFLSIIVY